MGTMPLDTADALHRKVIGLSPKHLYRKEPFFSKEMFHGV